MSRINAVPRLPSSLEKVEGDVLFLQSKITEVLGGSGYNTERLATPYVPQPTGQDSKQADVKGLQGALSCGKVNSDFSPDR